MNANFLITDQEERNSKFQLSVNVKLKKEMKNQRIVAMARLFNLIPHHPN